MLPPRIFSDSLYQMAYFSILFHIVMHPSNAAAMVTKFFTNSKVNFDRYGPDASDNSVRLIIIQIPRWQMIAARCCLVLPYFVFYCAQG